MCGILGAFHPSSMLSRRLTGSLVDALDLVSHRGPNGYGIWLDGAEPRIAADQPAGAGTDRALQNYLDQRADRSSVFFGHRRLSIIDLSTEAFQPMSIPVSSDSSGARIWLIFNGEVYNYLELREELLAEGIRFKTASDTEVILRAYERWGTDCFSRFNGMWAMAFWDERTRQLLLSRDRMGVKPLYYAVVNGALCFGSEIKQLLKLSEDAGVPRRWNPYRVHEFLSESLIHHSEDTIYEGVFSLRGGHYALIGQGQSLSIESFRSNIRPFWDVPSESETLSIDFEEAATELRRLLESSVSLRLRSDVTVGSALSGGLDSSAIVSIISRLDPKEQKTVSAVYEGASINEKPFAEKVIEGTRISPIFVQPDAETLMADLEKLLYHNDGPVWASTIYAQWEVFRTARKNDITVMLDGQGADEIFAGYEGFLGPHLKNVSRVFGASSALSEGVRFVLNHPRYYGWKMLSRKLSPGFEWMDCYSQEFRSEIIERRQAVRRQDGDTLLFGSKSRKYGDSLKEALYRSTVCTSLPALLAFEDRTSMAFGIESRTPFLDYRIVEFAFRCPSHFHIRNGMRKALLREALRGILPESIRMRKDKLGFATPDTEWRKQYLPQLKRVALAKLPSHARATFGSKYTESMTGPRSWRAIVLPLSY